MRIIKEKRLKDYSDLHPDARTALQDWAKKVRSAEWRSFADIKKMFNSVDAIGGQRYVFNIRGNNHRLVVVVKFTMQFVLIRFIGTHAEYDKIDCSTI
ncbi:MAG: type II toxin-antitoxin system HigB family toxin [Muribaculaceae bacterium]|nr:type II toxin-antitoxin system HigB family toxin [Muribaculaceae bacterium]